MPNRDPRRRHAAARRELHRPTARHLAGRRRALRPGEDPLSRQRALRGRALRRRDAGAAPARDADDGDDGLVRRRRRRAAPAGPLHPSSGRAGRRRKPRPAVRARGRSRSGSSRSAGNASLPRRGAVRDPRDLAGPDAPVGARRALRASPARDVAAPRAGRAGPVRAASRGQRTRGACGGRRARGRRRERRGADRGRRRRASGSPRCCSRRGGGRGWPASSPGAPASASSALYLLPDLSRARLGAAAGAGLVVAIAFAWALRRWPYLLAFATLACIPLRLPVDIGSDEVNLLLPLYAVIGGLALSLGWAFVRGDDRARELGPVALPLAAFVALDGPLDALDDGRAARSDLPRCVRAAVRAARDRVRATPVARPVADVAVGRARRDRAGVRGGRRRTSGSHGTCSGTRASRCSTPTRRSSGSTPCSGTPRCTAGTSPSRCSPRWPGSCSAASAGGGRRRSTRSSSRPGSAS